MKPMVFSVKYLLCFNRYLSLLVSLSLSLSLSLSDSIIHCFLVHNNRLQVLCTRMLLTVAGTHHYFLNMTDNTASTSST
jgi:hypothetical protein